MTIASRYLAVIFALMSADALGDVHCLTNNIYFEARNQSERGQMAVALVTLNRVKSGKYPNSVCGVVYQPHQFSWTGRDLNYRTIHDTKALVVARRIAVEALGGAVSDFTRGALHYYAHGVITPVWAREAYNVQIIGGHTFLNLKG